MAGPSARSIVLSPIQRSILEGIVRRTLACEKRPAEFLTDQAADKHDLSLAVPARKLCADIMLEDIDYRGIRELCAKTESQTKNQKDSLRNRTSLNKYWP